MGEQNRESLGSRLGFLLLSAGCAIGLDTFVAICAGLIIFPSCAAFGVEPSSGPGLAFVSLPNVFNEMGPLAGRIVGAFFFLFMSFASLSTVVAVFENIVAFPMDRFGWTRRKSVLVNFVAILLLATPAALGMNVWSAVRFYLRYIAPLIILAVFIAGYFDIFGK